MGTTQGVLQRSVISGVVTGLISGAFWGALAWGRSPTSAMVGLSFRERRAVMTSVRTGKGVSSPALALATIGEAARVQQENRHFRSALLLAGTLLALSLLALGVGVAAGSLPAVAAGAFSVAVWAVILIVGPVMQRRRGVRALAAEQAARRLLGENRWLTPPTPPAAAGDCGPADGWCGGDPRGR